MAAIINPNVNINNKKPPREASNNFIESYRHQIHAGYCQSGYHECHVEYMEIQQRRRNMENIQC